MSKQRIIDYVMNTPGNTNPNVLNTLLDSEASSNKFIVTLTPTAPDYSGTMDKTVAEINAAHKAGQEIVFRVLTSTTTYVDVPCSLVGRNTGMAYPDFNAEVIDYHFDVLIVAYTGDTNDGTQQTYSTIVYGLTPAN